MSSNSSNPEYDDLRRCYSENKYWTDKAHAAFKKDLDLFSKERQYCLQKKEEVLNYVKETYGMDAEELRYRVQALDRQQEQQPRYHAAEPRFDRYQQNTASNEAPEQEKNQQPQKELHGMERYLEAMEQQKHHEREHQHDRNHDFDKEKDR